MDSAKKLVQIEYSAVNGMMFGEDLCFTVNESEVVFARFFDRDSNTGDYTVIENKPISGEQWLLLEKAVCSLSPILTELPKPKVSFFSRFIRKVEMTDGPNYTHFFLTWQDENGTQTQIQYYPPNDSRFSTLLALLCETAEPRGRESAANPLSFL